MAMTKKAWIEADDIPTYARWRVYIGRTKIVSNLSENEAIALADKINKELTNIWNPAPDPGWYINE